jgi:hypothetical protein
LGEHLRNWWIANRHHPTDAARTLSALGLCVATLAWVLLLGWAIRLFRPDSSLLRIYTSDCAIPLLMTQGPCDTPFCIYYLGQDRFGGWPFLFAHWFGRAMQFAWSPERLSAWLILFIFSSAWPLRALAGKRDFIVPAYLGILLLNRVLQLDLFATDGVYGWQAPALIWTWWFLRRLSLSDRPGSWFASACLGSLLATWSSPLSGVILALLGCVEWGYAHWQTAPNKARWKRLALLLIPSVFGLAFEAGLRRWFYHYTTLKFNTRYITVIRLDRGHLLENASALWSVLTESRFWVFHLATTLAGTLFLASWIARLRRPTSSAAPKDDWRALAIGCAIICVVTFCVSTALSHVRDNDHHQRYLVLVHLFGGLGAVATLAALVPQLQSSLLNWRAWSIGLTGALALAVGFALPSAKPNPAYRDLKEAANWLADRANPVVLGGYWGSYVFAGLAVPKRVVPVPIEEDYQRTPWTSAAIHQSTDLFISTYWSDHFGPVDHPDHWVSERGEFLERAETPAFQRGEVTLWPYRNETRRALPISSSLVPSRWNACGQAPLSLTFPPVARVELIYWLRSPNGPTLQLVGRTQSGLDLAPSTIERGTRMVSYRFEAVERVSRVTLRPAEGGEKCELHSLAVLER